MPEIRMRRKHQVTLPASIVREANIELDDKLIVTLTGGKIIITPKKVHEAKDDVMAYAGMFRGTWGTTSEEVDHTIHNLHNEWER